MMEIDFAALREIVKGKYDGNIIELPAAAVKLREIGQASSTIYYFTEPVCCRQACSVYFHCISLARRGGCFLILVTNYWI
jgi:hypothetical protein